jgi:amidohydrolase
MNSTIIDTINSKAAAIFEKVIAYRKHLHAHPELSFQEVETMKFVAEKLTELGIEHTTGIGKTGVVALIKAAHHTDEMSCIGLRADLDALPILEETGLDFASTNKGVMHACGHDVHTSILLGTAEILAELRHELPQPVKLIFQPGEEQNPGGATLMLADGVLENPTVKEMYALHVFPEMETGKIGFKEGLYMASSDEIHLTIHGKGGHGATPAACIDPIVIGANLIVQLQQIISRKCNPSIPSVLTFGHFEALGSTNVIPSKAILKGTFRTMDETWRAEALSLLKTQIHALVESQGATVELTISKGYPFLKNDPVTTSNLKSKAAEILGKENVIELPIRMTSEDFAFYAQQIPVCFFRLGVRNEAKGIIHAVHNSKFDSDDAALLTGMKSMAIAVF